MFDSHFYTRAIFLAVALSLSPSGFAVEPPAEDASAAERLLRLERRLAELEAELAETKKNAEKAEAAPLSTAAEPEDFASLYKKAAFDILTADAWRDLRWTEEKQWDNLRKGISETEVIELLGRPPRSVKSLKPRVDKVFYYETALRDRSNSLRGKVQFREGRVIAFTKPDFPKASR